MGQTGERILAFLILGCIILRDGFEIPAANTIHWHWFKVKQELPFSLFMALIYLLFQISRRDA